MRVKEKGKKEYTEFQLIGLSSQDYKTYLEHAQQYCPQQIKEEMLINWAINDILKKSLALTTKFRTKKKV